MKTINFGDISLVDFIKRFNTEKKYIRFLEKELRKSSKPVSPYGPSSKVCKRSDGEELRHLNHQEDWLKTAVVFGNELLSTTNADGTNISFCKYRTIVQICQIVSL